MLKALPAFRKI